VKKSVLLSRLIELAQLDNRKEYAMAGKTDKLFGDAGDWHYNLMLRYGANDFVLLVSGYREAGERLVNSIESQGAYDGLIYPIIFLYRQYIELSLKLLIRDGSILINPPDNPFPSIKPKEVNKNGKKVKFNFGFPDHHDLSALWTMCKEILEKADQQYLGMNLEAQTSWKAAERLIKEFNKVDPGSDDSRYLVNRQGDLSLSELGWGMNAQQLARAMDGLVQSLDGLHEIISEALATFRRAREP
jgi:hypothetical protein